MVRTIHGSSSINFFCCDAWSYKICSCWNAQILLICFHFSCFFFFSFELSDCILQCLNDGTPDVRDSAFSVLAAVAKVVFPFKKNIENLLLHF